MKLFNRVFTSTPSSSGRSMMRALVFCFCFVASYRSVTAGGFQALQNSRTNGVPAMQFVAETNNAVAVAKLHYNNAARFLQALQFSNAIVESTLSIQAYPTDCTYLLRGYAYSYLSKHSDAINDFKVIIGKYKPTSYIYYCLAGEYAELSMFECALSNYNKAIAMAPDVETYYEGRAILYRKANDFYDTITDYSHCLSLQTNRWDLLPYRGAVYELVGKYYNAMKDYELAVTEQPNNIAALSNFSYFLAGCPDAHYRDGARALALAKAAGEISHWNDPTIFGAMAAAYAERGQFENAVSWQTKKIDLDNNPDDMRLNYELLSLYRNSKPYRAMLWNTNSTSQTKN